MGSWGNFLTVYETEQAFCGIPSHDIQAERTAVIKNHIILTTRVGKASAKLRVSVRRFSKRRPRYELAMKSSDVPRLENGSM